MDNLTLLTSDVSAGLVQHCASLMNNATWHLDDAEECRGPGAAWFAEKGRFGIGTGSSKSWRSGPMTTTLWSDGEGQRIAILVEDERNVERPKAEIGMEMPRSLTFLRSVHALKALMKSIKRRIGTSCLTDHPRAVNGLARADGLIAALSLEAMKATDEIEASKVMAIRLPSPLQPKGTDGPLFSDGDRELVATAAFRELMRRRVPSTLRIVEGRSSDAIMLQGETRTIDFGNRDPMEMLRIGVAASRGLSHAHPPLVEWRAITKRSRT
jgi:hypothetical protein